MIKNTMNNQQSKPNTRINFYYDENDLALDLEMAEEYVKNDMNFTIVLFRINHQQTDTDDIYGESDPDDVQYFEPVELKVARFKIDEAKNASYNPNSTMRYQQYGNLTFDVLTTELQEKNVDVAYGDIIGYSDREHNFKVWTVQNDGKIIADNKHTRFGLEGYYRTVICVTLDPDLFNQFSEQLKRITN